MYNELNSIFYVFLLLKSQQVLELSFMAYKKNNFF